MRNFFYGLLLTAVTDVLKKRTVFFSETATFPWNAQYHCNQSATCFLRKVTMQQIKRKRAKLPSGSLTITDILFLTLSKSSMAKTLYSTSFPAHMKWCHMVARSMGMFKRRNLDNNPPINTQITAAPGSSIIQVWKNHQTSRDLLTQRNTKSATHPSPKVLLYRMSSI